LKSHLWQIFIKVFFPTRCLVCRKFYHHETLAPVGSSEPFAVNFGTFICPVCAGKITFIKSPLCLLCGVPFENQEGEDHVCGKCLTNSRKFGKARSLGAYDLTLKATILSLKYQGKTRLAGPLGTLLWQTFLQYWDCASIDLIIPVPLHAKRFRSRGFNQAYLLIQEWQFIKKNHGIDSRKLIVDTDILIRQKYTLPQTGLKQKERQSNVRNAFKIVNSVNLKGKTILLVDDVFTTGATVNECARVLLKSGAENVDVLTLARSII